MIRATSHTRLRARDHYTSSTLIGGKDGADPSSLHITLEGPTEYSPPSINMLHLGPLHTTAKSRGEVSLLWTKLCREEKRLG